MINLSISEQKQISGGLWAVRAFKKGSNVAFVVEAWDDIADARKREAYWKSLTDSNGNTLYNATVSYMPSHSRNY